MSAGTGHHLEEQIVLTYRNAGTLQIDMLFFSTFFGGHDPTWATPIDTYADFAAFELYAP